MHIPARLIVLLTGSGIMLLPACGSKAGEANDADKPVASGAESPSATPERVPDACTFITKSELERLVGRELRDGDRNDAPAGFSQCDFETAPGASTTHTYDNPPLPEAAGFSSITITTHPTSPQTFAQSRRAIGAGAELVRGIGDEAYFEGPGTIHVRVGHRGLGIRFHMSEPESEAGRQTLRKVMLSLATAVAGKL